MTDFVSGKAAIAGAEGRRCELKRELTKTLRIMKLAAILLFAAAMHVTAKGLSQDKITLSLKNAPMEKVFGEIEAQSGFVFIYKDETIRDKKVSIHVTNVSLADALTECLKGQELSYRIVGKSVAIKPVKKEAEFTDVGAVGSNGPPLIDVKGRVQNEKGEPVEGVTVRVRGTEKVTLTDKNGEFSLVTVERDAVLVFTHITMETFTLKVSGQSELLISLKTKVSSLGEVVVSVNTGYQTVSKERFVGSVSTMDSALYNRRAGMDIISRLDGNVSGILFDKKSGSGGLNTIQIRGLSTLTGLQQSANSAPLIIVNNFPFKQDLSTINPNDVESVTVLKDAAAASIWGAQAGNGVIVITTKKGRFNQPVRVSLSSNITIQEKPDQYYYPKISVSDFIDAETLLFNKGNYDASLANTSTWPVLSPVVEMLAKRRAGIISAKDSADQIDAFRSLDLRRDLDKYVYRSAISQQHYVNVSGGNNLVNYSFSGGYNRALNNIQNSKGDDQFTLNSNAGFKPIKSLEINTGINFSQSNRRSSTFSLPSKIYPYAQLADVEGRALAIPNQLRVAYLDTAGGGSLLDWKYRPLDEIKAYDRNDIVRFVQFNTSINYRLFSWLTATANYQYSMQSAEGNLYNSVESFFARNLINQYTNLAQANPNLRNPIPIGGIMQISHSESKSQNIRGQLNFNKSFRQIHAITAFVAADVLETISSGSSNTIYGYNNNTASYRSTIDFLTDFPLYGGGGVTGKIPGVSVIRAGETRRFVSFIGNASYSYKNLFTFYASARKDGSNVFGVNTNKQWKPLWSVGGSYDVSKANFYHIINVPLLRLRLSYGFMGNPGNASGLPTIDYQTRPSDLTGLYYATPSSPPNPDLRWESVRTINTSVDFGLLKNRITGSFEMWQKRCNDIISLKLLPASAGVLTSVTNTGSLKGNGFDLSLTSKNLIGTFNWQTSINLSYAKMKVTRLYQKINNTQYYTGYGQNESEGRIVYGLASYKWAGLDPATGDPQGSLGKTVSKDYQNIFNDSLQNQVFHGSSIPLYFGNINNSFSWKNFTLSANISYRLDFYFRKPTISYSQLVNSWQGHADYAQRWQKPGDENYTNVPSFTYPLNNNRDQFYQNSEVNVLRGDNMRLQDIRLQYVWGDKSLNKMPFKDLQFFVYVNNLNVILWRKNDNNLDPDFTVNYAFIAPTPKSWTLGFIANF